MFRDSTAFSSLSSNDIGACRQFYADTLGLEVTEDDGFLTATLPGGGTLVIYPKDDHRPAAFTVLNFRVPDVAAAVDELVANGVEIQRYPGFEQDERGIVRDQGSAIAWFTDPVGNILSVIEAG